MKKKKIYNIGWKSVIACYVTGFIVFGLLAFLVNLFTNYPKFSNETGLLRTCIQLAITAILLISHALYTFFADRSVMETPRKMWATMTAMLICYAVIEFASFWTYGLYAVPIALCAVMLSLLISDKCGFYANFVVIMLCFLQYINWQDVSTLDSEAYFYLLFGGVIQAVFASYIFGKGYRRINYVGYGLLLGVIAAVCSFAAYLMFIDGTTISWAEIGIKAGISFASGIICTMLMFVLVSLFEVSFDLVTVFRFSEIASSDNELMRRLFEKAPGTYNHCLTVAVYAEACAMAIGISVVEARAAAYYHDIGKLKIPQEILNKPGKYTDEEFALVKKHPVFGYELLKNLPIDTRIKKAALSHHERCDGTGYPLGLKQEDLDSCTMVVAIADVYDAMTAARSYRAPLCPFQVIERFEQDGLQKYNPKFILTFLSRIADTYKNHRVLLNDGRSATVVMINANRLSKPLIQFNDGSCIDLSKQEGLFIQTVL